MPLRKVLKARNTLQKCETGTKKRRFEVESEKILSRSVSDESSKEHLDLLSEEEGEEEIMAYKEPTMYANLLETLSSGRGSVANAYKKRQTDEEMEKDIEDMSSGSESSDAEEDEEAGKKLQ